MRPAEPAIETRSLAVSIDGRWVVRNLDITLLRGQFTVIAGPNGAGKTTLIRALAGIEAAWGEIDVGGVALERLDPLTRARAIAYLPQGHPFHWPMQVADIVALGRIPHADGYGGLSEADRMAVADAMADTDTLDLAERRVTSLSGGERARVALARAFAVAAPVLLADEPTATLDPRFALRVAEALSHHANDGTAVVAVMQDLALAARFADRLVVMKAGEIVADGAPEEVLSEELLRRVFGVTSTPVRANGGHIHLPWLPVDRGPQPDH